MASVRWINMDNIVNNSSESPLILFSRIDINKIDLAYDELLNWTTESLDVGHFSLNINTNLIGAGNRLKCYSKINGVPTIIAIIDLDKNISNGYYYSIRVEYPKYNGKLINCRLKSTVADNTMGDQVFVFNSPQHTKDINLIDVYEEINKYKTTSSVSSSTYIEDIVQSNESPDLVDLFEYYEFVS